MKNKYVCDCEKIHEENLSAAQNALPDILEMNKLTNLFKQISYPTRLKILLALLIKELCVCDLAVLLSMTKSAVSHQLGYLRESGLVSARREGKNVFYTLSDDCVSEIIGVALKHIRHDEAKKA